MTEQIGSMPNFHYNRFDSEPKAELVSRLTMTDEMRNKLYDGISLRQRVAEFRLLACVFMLSASLQDAVGKLIDTATRQKLFSRYDKINGSLNRLKRNTDSFIRMCASSERRRLASMISSGMPCYYDDYVADGGYFYADLTISWYNDTKSKFEDLYLKVDRFLDERGVSSEWNRWLVVTGILCSMFLTAENHIRDILRKNISAFVVESGFAPLININLPEVHCDLLDSFVHVDNIVDALFKSRFAFSFKEVIQQFNDDLRSLVVRCCGSEGKELVARSIDNANKDYADYCIARLVLYYRGHTSIDPSAVPHLDLSDDDKSALADELAALNSCKDIRSEDDVRDIMLLIVPYISTDSLIYAVRRSIIAIDD